MKIATVTGVGVTGTMGDQRSRYFAPFGNAKVYAVGRDIEKVKKTIPRIVKSVKADIADSEYILPWTRQAVLDACKRSGLLVDDIDVIETHDCFTLSEYAAISFFGLTDPGQEYEAVESGLISFDGGKPINPSGGLIGCGHPVGASGARMLLDIYKQVEGKAGAYQVIDVKNVMMLNIDGSATTNYVFIVGK